jgi:uncharacterized protein
MRPPATKIGPTTIELFDPRVDPEPPEWAAYQRTHGLSPQWTYELVGAASREARSPSVLAMLREDAEVTGVFSAVVSGAVPLRRRPGAYPRAGIVDVRLPGSRNTAWHLADPAPERFRAFERAAYRRFGPGIRGVLYRAVPDDQVDAVGGRGRVVRPSTPATRMELPWASLDEWLATRSRSRRQDLRRITRKLRKDPDLRIEFGFRRTDLDPAEVTRLVRRHQKRLAGRFGARWQQLAVPYVARLLDRDDVGLATYHDANGRLLAFGMLLDNGDWPVIHWWAALAPEEGGRLNLYFDHYVRFLEWCIANGRRGVDGGRGLANVKASLGFEPVGMHLVAAPRWLR